MRRAAPALLFCLAACGRSSEVEPIPDALLAPAEAPDIVDAHDFSSGVVEFDAHEGAVTDLAFLGGPDRLVTISFDDSRVALWDAGDGSLIAEARHDRRPQSVAALPDGSGFLTSDAYGYLVLWRLSEDGLAPPQRLHSAGGKDALDTIEQRLGHHARLAISPNGLLLATSSWDSFITIWDLTSKKELRRIATDRKMRSIAFAPDGASLAAGGVDNTWTSWDLRTGASRTHEISKVSATSDVSGLAFSSDGRWLATGHMDSSLTLWDPTAGKELRNWFVKGSSIHRVAFTPGGERLAAAEHSGRVSLWPTEKGRPGELQAFESGAVSLAISPDGSTLAAGSDKGGVVLFR